MENDFENDLKGTPAEATAAKQKIEKYFKRYGDSGHLEARKHQLMFASKIMCTIAKCENKHMDLYCNIIIETFADHLCPEASVKYWTLYVNCIRYFHYLLADKKDFEKASLIYRHISAYDNKLQSNENSLTYIHINCYQLFLQNSLRVQNQDLAVSEATKILENLTKLFNDVLETNKKHNFQYPDLLKKVMQWLFLQNRIGAFYQFIKYLPQNKVKEMFCALFSLYGRQTFDKTFDENESQEQAKFVIETIYSLLQLDIMDKMQLQLAVQLVGQCRTESRLQSYKPIADSFLLLYDYLKLLCSQKSIVDFQQIYSIRCERFKELFDKYSKNVMHQPWFGDFLVLLFYLHSQLQNITIFGTFWKQMSTPHCYTSIFKFFMELMKLAPCISAETKLFTINCCSSTRKHVILSFAQIALAAFVFYCQNVSEDDEKQEELENRDSNLTDNYKETIQNNLLLIINHAFKIIDKMDCITDKSQEIEIILTRFKQATLSCKSYKQAGTCVSICELFLKIKTKIPGKEWPLLLRRLYKTVIQHINEAPHIGRDIQMCYIASLLHETISEIDIGQIRTQINIFYAGDSSVPLTHENCLLNLYQNTTSLLRPHLEPSRKKLLHWLESQHVLKYYKTNTALLHSILKSSQTHYDFVIITKLGKLQTYAMAKISSLYKSFKSKTKEMIELSRVEYLTFAHVCVILLTDMNSNQKFQVDSKDLNEEHLESLLRREEMSTFTLNNDLKRFKLAWEAFKAFELFFEKFDSEPISMNDAIIDWESILDDLASLALCLQLSGYMEHCSRIWLLHYKCSRLIQDAFSALRGLTFFCEYSEHYGKNDSTKAFELEDEIQYHFPTIMQGLENLTNLQRQTYQNYILLAVLQIAYYYARTSRLTFAQMLIQYVEEKHAELVERLGRYDIILATMDVIKFRLMWKHFDAAKSTADEMAVRTSAENLLLHRCLLHEVQETLDRLYEFSYISSCDGLLYSIMIIGLVQELAECTVNRLCDNFINALFIATTKCTLLMGLALRFVQVMGMWMWVNLQMEYVDKAQTKLKIIEYVMGMKSLNEIMEKSTKNISDIQSSTLLPTQCVELFTQNQYNPGMEAIRRLAQVHLSPIKTDKLQLSPSHRNTDLKRYFKCNVDAKLMPQNEQIEWTLFMVGCLNARLYFLVEDYDQLETFYERGSKWLQMRNNSFNKKYYKNIQLMAMQHYANFLRARKKYDKAVQCLQYGMELCENMKFYVDAVYYVNFQLQLLATQKQMGDCSNVKVQLPTYSKIRRALQFHISPENVQHKEQAKKDLKEKLLQNVMASGKKPTAIMRPLPSIISGSGCSSSKKPKTQTGASISSSSSSSSTSSLDSKITKPKFEICEDSIEIVEVTDTIAPVINSEEAVKTIKRTKSLEEPEQLHKTPKVTRTTAKTTKTTTASKREAKIKRPELVPPQYHIDIDLTDTPKTSPQKISTSTSSLENLDAKENLNTNDLIAQMENLEIKSTKRTKASTENEIQTKTTRSRGRKPNLVKETVAPVVIVLEDSPCTLKPAPKNATKEKTKSRNQATSRDKSSSNEDTVDAIAAAESRPRRQRRLVLDKTEKPAESIECTTTASVTRRRQKKIV
ncbi:hypothetical protein FF38_13333 [Lucilia cuprina]|uniref:Protein three rows n=1 Tax=Lucilia cuprina TaxID=7375 RepID=A0A0L0BTW4_LUCCU|nr:Protein three rows [Lucilia cuprina]KNC23418.1 hypothetical protein FF38_13333 [Lucilia cuprina]